jgi:hypothetical protein
VTVLVRDYWFTPVIPGTWEAEIRLLLRSAQAKFSENLSQKTSWAWCAHL